MVDHPNRYDNNEKLWNFVRITKMWYRDTSEEVLLEKRHQ